MQIAFVLDIIIAVLLVLTITYAVRLNQRLSQLRGDKKELQELAKTFAEATAKAESSIRKLKVSTESLQAEVDKAEALKDDLAYLVDRGGRTADQMVDNVRAVKPQASQASHAPQARDYEDEDDGRLIQDAIRAATGVQPRGPQGRPQPARSPRKPDFEDDFGAPAAATSRKVQPLGGGLGGVRPEDRLLGDGGPKGEPETVGETDAARELLKALSSVK